MIVPPMLILSGAGTRGGAFHAWSYAIMCFVLFAISTSALGQDWTYTARPGDNLWNISRDHLIAVDYWRRLQEYNGIADSDIIRPGTKIRMPIAWLKRQPSPALLTQIRGSVERVRGDGGTASVVSVGATLQVGDRLVTGENSSATIRFADGSRVLLQSNTDLTLDTMSAYGSTGMVDTSMRLHGGRIENEVPPAVGPGSRYRIITPPAVAAVRGTSFRVAFDPSAATALGEVLDGALGVSAQDVTRAVPAGFGVATKVGEPPGEPARLLPAPDLSGLPDALPAQRIVFEWPAVQGASIYRGQVFAAADTERLLQESVLTRPRAEWQPLPVGEYLLRVRAIDASSLEGLNADHVFSIEALALPPVPMQPDDSAVIAARSLVLTWTVPPGVASFHVQISRSLRFSDLVIDAANVRDWRYRPPEALIPGQYFWRLASIGRDGRQGPFGDPRQFHIRVAPEAPMTEAVSADYGQLALSWRARSDAAGYRLQLARDAGFSRMVTDEKIRANRFRISGLSPGTYYFRAQSIGDDGLAGAFGAASRIEIPGWPLMQIAIALAGLLAILLVVALRRR